MDFAMDFGMLYELPLCHSFPEKLVLRCHKCHHYPEKDILVVDQMA
jgi:hypothetical protein